MSTKLFFSSIVGSAERAFAFISKALGVSCRLIIGKDLKGATLLWNDLVRRMYGYEPIEVLDMANSLDFALRRALHVSFQGTEKPIHYDSLSASMNLMKPEGWEQ